MAYLSQEHGIHMSNNINNSKQTQDKQQQTSIPNNVATSTSTWSNVTKKPPAMRVDPSDGKAYPFASFRQVYGKDADRLWRLAGEAQAFRARHARKPAGPKKRAGTKTMGDFLQKASSRASDSESVSSETVSSVAEP